MSFLKWKVEHPGPQFTNMPNHKGLTHMYLAEPALLFSYHRQGLEGDADAAIVGKLLPDFPGISSPDQPLLLYLRSC